MKRRQIINCIALCVSVIIGYYARVATYLPYDSTLKPYLSFVLIISSMGLGFLVAKNNLKL